MTTHYEILEVSQEASHDEVKKAYRSLVKITHPDVNSGKGSALFQLVQEAWEVLGDPTRRADYDLTLTTPPQQQQQQQQQQQPTTPYENFTTTSQQQEEEVWGEEDSWEDYANNVNNSGSTTYGTTLTTQPPNNKVLWCGIVLMVIGGTCGVEIFGWWTILLYIPSTTLVRYACGKPSRTWALGPLLLGVLLVYLTYKAMMPFDWRVVVTLVGAGVSFVAGPLMVALNARRQLICRQAKKSVR